MKRNERVCLITHEFPPEIGGVGQSALRVATLMVEAGVDLEVLVLARHATPVPLDESITSEESEGLLVHRALIWMPGWSADSTKRVFMGSEATTRFNREAFEIIRLLQSKRSYNLLHGFFLYPAGFLAVTVARWAGIRSIVSIRGNDVGRNAFDPQLRTFISATLEQADYVTSVTDGLLDFAHKTICSVAGKSRVILNSFDARNAKVEAQTEMVPSRPIVGAAGVFRYKKGLIYLFKALSTLHQSHSFNLLLAGGFRDRHEEEVHLRQLKELNLTNRTTITGMITHAHLLGYLDLFDILVLPSMFSEGCPMVMLEAMSRRRAIIASRSGAIPEVIINEETGLLFDVGNSSELEKQIRRLLNEPELRRSLGENAHRKSLLLSPAREQEAWLGAYHEAIARSN